GWLADVAGLAAVLGTDADLAGLAEALHGAGRGLSPVFYITIGSGIGGGLVLDGEVYRGCGRGAAEVGHLRLDSWPTSGSGSALGPAFGTLEDYASGWAIERWARDALSSGKGLDSLLR